MAYFTTKNKWPQEHFLYQFPHYFWTHLGGGVGPGGGVLGGAGGWGMGGLGG